MRKMWFVLVSCLCLAGPLDAQAKLELPHVDTDAKNYLERLKKVHGGKRVDRRALDAEQKRARDSGQAQRAVELNEILVATGDDRHQRWIVLAETWFGSSPDRNEPVWAAYLAYLRASKQTERVAALRALGNTVFQRYKNLQNTADALRQKLRDAPGPLSEVRATQDLIALSDELAASLADLRRVYRELLTETRPTDEVRERAVMSDPDIFRPRKGRVDVSDKAAAYCVDFNLALRPDGAEYQGFFQLRQEPEDKAFRQKEIEASLLVKGRSLCAVGLEHGRTYSLTVKKGLPSQSGLALVYDRETRFKVPDRDPQIRFLKSAFVLPQHTEKAIPIGSVNVERMEFDLVRINDRNIVRDVAVGKILNRDDSDFESRRSRIAETLWRGSARLNKFERNKQTVTNLPIGRLLAEREARLERADGDLNSLDRRIKIEGLEGEIQVGKFKFQQLADQERSASRAAAASDRNGVYALVMDSDPKSGEILRDEKLPASDMPAQTSDKPSPEEVVDEEGTIIRNDPAKHSSMDPDSGSTVQWFVVTDIGLTYYSGPTKLYVIARSLQTGQPLEGVEIQLVSAGNRVLATTRTKNEGVAEFPARLARGEEVNRLAAILAFGAADFSFIDFTRDAFDMSRRGVEGRPPPGPIQAFVYPDRGIYRPGEVIKPLILVRDAAGAAVERFPPVTLLLRAPDGKTITSKPLAENWQIAGAVSELTIPMTTPLGSARLEVQLGNGGERIGMANLQIQHFRPDRARLEFKKEAWRVVGGNDGSTVVSGSAQIQYLYGARADGKALDAMASGVSGELEFRLVRARSPFRECYGDFAFGRHDEEFTPFLKRAALEGVSDENGLLPLRLRLEQKVTTSLPLEAQVGLSVFDDAGNLARRAESIDFPQDRSWLGIRLAPASDTIRGEKVAFEVLPLTADNKLRRPTQLVYELWRERDDFIWLQSDDQLRYRTDIARTLVSRGQLQTRPQAATAGTCRTAQLSADEFKLEPGRYQIRISDESEALTTYRFPVGWNSADTEESVPDKLVVRTRSKDGRHSPGPRQLHLALEAPFDGKALIAIAAQDIVLWRSADVSGRTATLDIDIPDGWSGRSFYALATVFRHHADRSDPKANYGPARAIGAVYFEVALEHRRLDVQVNNVEISPSSTAAPIPVQVDVKGAGNAPAWLAAFAVDEGIVSLTNHPAADPYGALFERQAFAFEIMDSYGRIIRTDQGNSNRGGDQLDLTARVSAGNYISENILALAVQPVEVKNDRAIFYLNPRDFAGFEGTARLVVVGWTHDKVGAAQSNVLSRSPVVLQVGAPRFLAPGDIAQLSMSLHALESEGRFAVDITADAPAVIKGVRTPDATIVPSQSGTASLELDIKRGQRRTLAVTLEIPAGEIGEQVKMKVALRSSAAQQDRPVSVSGDWTISLRPAVAPTVQVVSFSVRPGETRPVSYATFRDFFESVYLPKTLRLNVRVAAGAGSGGHSVAAADRSVRAVERLVWEGLGLLASSESGSSESRAALDRLVGDILALQKTDGSFDPVWNMPEPPQPSSDEEQKPPPAPTEERRPWSTALALDFLVRAERHGVAGTAAAQASARDYLQSQVANQIATADTASPPASGAPDTSACNLGTMYSALVLARTNQVSPTDLARFDDFCAKNRRSPREQAMMASAFRAFGISDRADKLLASLNVTELTRNPEKSVDDRTMLWALLVEAAAPPALIDAVFASIADQGTGARHLSTGALAWLARGLTDSRKNEDDSARVYAELSPQNWVAAKSDKEISSKWFGQSELQKEAITILNSGKSAIRATVTLRGVPRNLEKPANQSFRLRRRIFDRYGNELKDRIEVRRHDSLFIVLEGQRSSPAPTSGPTAARSGPGTGGGGRNVQPSAPSKAAKKTDRPTVVPPAEPDEPPPADPSLVRPVLLTDLLPAGFEIVREDIFAPLTKRLTGDVTPLPFRGAGRMQLVEARDDRWLAIVEPDTEGDPAKSTFRAGYSVRASVAGRFALPSAVAEDLEQADFAAYTRAGSVTVTAVE
jgi:uncharacterized protein YfaS (alpha-2-macroglobulin family)